MHKSFQQYGIATQLLTGATGVLAAAASTAFYLGYFDSALPGWLLSASEGNFRFIGTILICLISLLPGLLVLRYLNRQFSLALATDLQIASRIFLDLKYEDLENDEYRPRLREFASFFSSLSLSSDKIAEERRRLIDFGLTDHLSQLPNRRALDIKLRETLAHAQFGINSSILLIDLDNFKTVNDVYGHDTGDVLIKCFARLLCSHVRESDFVARLGGDEFCIIFINSPLSVAMELAQRLRQELPMTVEIGAEIIQPLFWTAGLAAFKSNDQECDDVLRRADQALLKAKHAGKNQTHSATQNDSDKTLRSPTTPAFKTAV